MSDRYNPKRLVRERIAQIARGETPRSVVIAELEKKSTAIRDARGRLVPQALHCHHGVVWTACTTCSRPKTKE